MTEVQMYGLGLLMVLFTGGVIFFMVRDLKQKKITFGEWLNSNFLREQISWIVIMLFFIIISEGLLAATIPTDHEFVNPIARLIAHTSISFLSLIKAIGIPRAIIELVKSISLIIRELRVKNNARIGDAITVSIINLCISLLTGYLAVMLPYWNVLIIANGLGEVEMVEYAFREVLHGPDWMLEYYKALGKVPQDALTYDIEPFKEMSMTMSASWVLFIAHVALTFLDGLYATKETISGDLTKSHTKRATTERLNKRKDVDSNQIKKIVDNIEDALEVLLNFTGIFRSEDKKTEKLDDMAEIFYDISDVDTQNKIAAKVGRLFNKVTIFEDEARTLNKGQAAAKKNTIISEIERLAEGSPKDGEGFGSPLPRRRGI